MTPEQWEWIEDPEPHPLFDKTARLTVTNERSGNSVPATLVCTGQVRPKPGFSSEKYHGRRCVCVVRSELTGKLMAFSKRGNEWTRPKGLATIVFGPEVSSQRGGHNRLIWEPFRHPLKE